MSYLTSSNATKRSYFPYLLMVLSSLNMKIGIIWLEPTNPNLEAHDFRKMVER